MASPGNEPEFNDGVTVFHQQGQSGGVPSLDTDLLSDPSHLISLILSGSDGHGMSSARRRERERVYVHLPREELLNMLIDKEYEAKRLLKVLRASVQRLNTQYTRISEVERDNQEALDRLRQINQSRIEAQQDASRANQELELYRIQLQNAQQDLTRAWNAVQTLQQQRDEAENAAARARAKARRFRQQRLVDAARAEGRRWGFHDGFERAKQAFAVTMTSTLPVNDSLRSGDDPRTQEVEAEEREEDVDSARSSSPEIIQPTEVRVPSGHSESSAIQHPFGGFPPSHPSTSHPPPPSQQPLEPLPGSDPLAPPITQPENILPVVQPSAPSGSNRPADFGNQTPTISVFQVDFADTQQELGSSYGNQNQHLNNTQKNPWVTAQQHQAQHSQIYNDDPRYGQIPDQADPSRPQIPPPSAADEKKKASWYRSFSFRNKFGKRRVIDPDPVQEATTANTVEVEVDPDEEEIYRQAREPSVSWYQPSTRASRHRASSAGSASASTHVSQLPLVNTPLFFRDINASNGSLSIKSGKDTGMIKKIKEKESFLSVINEDPMSREHTPTTDRFAINRSRTPDIPHFATMGNQFTRGPTVLSDSRYPQFTPASGAESSSGRHRRTMSDGTPPVTIMVQTPSHSRTSSDIPRHNEELPNRFLSPSVASHPLPRSPKFQAGTISPQTRARSPSHQTSAMNIRENYLAKRAADESHGPARPASRQSNRSSAVMGKNSGLPAAASSPNMNEQALPRVQSNVSLRSQGHYDKFDLTKYRDPADYAPNAEPSRHALTRPASRNSGLSDAYIDERP
ncbi:hypothetical protein APHAL10511_004708 [Amanita phalloides]|nr:hypothetical protein APHAL10511_004708 [Amanita phalloides]